MCPFFMSNRNGLTAEAIFERMLNAREVKRLAENKVRRAAKAKAKRFTSRAFNILSKIASAVSPFLFDMKNGHIRGVFNLSEVYPSLKTNLNGHLHLLQAFLTSTTKTKRTPTLSTRRWIVSVLLHSLESNDDTPSLINVNIFYARHPQALKVKALRRPSSIQS
jgi:hypothetical protein